MENLSSYGVQNLSETESFNYNGGGIVPSFQSNIEGLFNVMIAGHSFLHGFLEGIIYGTEDVIKASN
jgi:hypothetical protein